MMRLLLDICAFYWWDLGTDITEAARRAIENADNTFLSAASAWEVMTNGDPASSRSLPGWPAPL